MASKPRIVIGLDFGTTYSGIAWALEGSPDSLEVISTWPGGGNRTSQKVPTTICYSSSDIKFGFQTTHSVEVLRGIKLLLDEGQGKNYTPALKSKKAIEKLEKDVVEVVGDYLEKILSHATELLNRRLGNTLDCMDIKYVLTVPAVWSDKAKNSTLRAAASAGIPADKVSLVSEPEAAAIYCLDSLTHSIKENDAILVCDAGGGTVDLTSYRVKSVKPLSLEEATEGTGGICGSAILDQYFEELLHRLFGYREYMGLPENTQRLAMQYWQDHVKPNYVADMDFSVPFPGAKDNPQAHLEEGFLELDKAQIHSIFDPIMQKVEELVVSQMGRLSASGYLTKAILLAGGFGSSEYLFRRLQEAYPAVKVLQPPNAWSAVARGAVYHGLQEIQIESRISRRHYGIRHRTIYVSSLHNRDERYWDDLDEKWYVRNRMTWYIKKGESISEHARIKMPFSRKIRVSESRVLHSSLYFCSAEDVPDIWSDCVHALCTVKADLSKVPTALFELRRNSKGEWYYKIEYDLVLTLTSGGIVFELEFDGTSYGSVEADY